MNTGLAAGSRDTACDKGGDAGIIFSPMSKFLTLFLMKVHGVVIWPPPQPSNEAQKQTSWAASGMSILPPVAMHMRSDAASAPANAQQQPQLD